MRKVINFGEGFSLLPDTSHINNLELVNSATNSSHTIENKPGKQASVKIYYGISRQNENKISATEARLGLELFGDYVSEEQKDPNSHPNIRLLLDIIEHNFNVHVIHH